MHVSAVLLSLAGLVAAADMVRFESMTSPIGHVGALALRASGTCDIGTACGNSCIPIGARCCSRADHTYCRAGYRCTADGCCPLGKICSGPPVGGCDGGRVQCGRVCVPKGSQCCSQATGAFCVSGTSCVGTTRCDRPQGSGSGSGSGSRSGSSATTSDILGGVATTPGSGATNTYSLSSSTNIADTPGSGSGSRSGSGATTSDILGGVATTPGSGATNTYSLSSSTNAADSPVSASGSGSSSESSSVSGDSTTTARSPSSTGDRSQPPPSVGVGTTNSPRILLGLLAAVPLLI